MLDLTADMGWRSRLASALYGSPAGPGPATPYM